MKIILLLISITILAQSPKSFYFDFNKSVINNESRVDFENFIQNRNIQVTAIQGFCDAVDTEKYNLILAQKRIVTVENLLKSKNILFTNNYVVKAFGENYNQDEDYAKNRRVDVFYKIIEIENSAVGKTLEQKITEVKVGEKIVLKNLNFYNRSDVLLPESKPILNQLLKILNEKQSISIEIQGHVCCTINDIEQIASKRARFVYNFLIENGIKANRLSFKSFEGREPIFTIPEKTDEQENANRRVEIEIIAK